MQPITYLDFIKSLQLSYYKKLNYPETIYFSKMLKNMRTHLSNSFLYLQNKDKNVFSLTYT